MFFHKASNKWLYVIPHVPLKDMFDVRGAIAIEFAI